MSIRVKLVGYFLIMALLVPVLGFTALNRVRSINSNVQNLSDNAIPRLRTVDDMQKVQRDQQNAALAYIASGKVEDRQAYLDLGQKFDQQLGELTKSDSSDSGKELVKNITEQRTKFNSAGAQLVTARTTRDRNFENLRTKDNEMVQELAKIRLRFVSSGNTNPQDVSSVPTTLRNQVNDLLLGTEGMLHMVALQFALATGYTVAPDETVRAQFDTAGGTFGSWMNIAMGAGGSEDRAILQRVQTNFSAFESSARAMMAAADLSVKSRVTFTEAADSVNGSLGQYSAAVTQDVAEARENSSSAVSSAQSIIIGLSIAGFLLAGALGFWFAGTITRPIMHLRNVADRVSTGDMDNVEVNVNSKDEIGDLADSFRRMVASIRFLMTSNAAGDEDDEDEFKLDFGTPAAS
jgi:HAMP domain-containing protein